MELVTSIPLATVSVKTKFLIIYQYFYLFSGNGSIVIGFNGLLGMKGIVSFFVVLDELLYIKLKVEFIIVIFA